MDVDPFSKGDVFPNADFHKRAVCIKETSYFCYFTFLSLSSFPFFKILMKKRPFILKKGQIVHTHTNIYESFLRIIKQNKLHNYIHFQQFVVRHYFPGW